MFMCEIEAGLPNPANTRRSPNVVLMLGHRLRQTLKQQWVNVPRLLGME